MVTTLVLNLGSTSSKYAIYRNDECILNENIKHSSSVINQTLLEQEQTRQQLIEQDLLSHHQTLDNIDIIACRGGLLKPLSGGTYEVNIAMYNDLKSFDYGAHAANLSAMIGYRLGQKYHIPVFTTDPVVVDELIDEARVTGIPDIQRRSVFHALNQKAMARKYAKSTNKNYEDVHVIVAHMGGGISIGAHQQGRVIDVNEALYGEGPMAMDRAGSIPNDLLITYMESNQLSAEKLNAILSRESGLTAYFGTSNLKEIMMSYDTDEKVRLFIGAMALQISKVIGERAAILKGKVDQIILTGGMSYNEQLVELISTYVDWIAPISVYAGEHEMTTLADQSQRAFNQEISIQTYR